MATERRDNDLNNTKDSNPDPITGTPGAHPIGTGVGAAGGGAAGALIGAAVTGVATPAAPVGAVVGAVIGAVAGGLAGKGAGEAVNPTAEDAYWRRTYTNRPYYSADYSYDEDYLPAYQYGWTSRTQHTGRRFEDVENDLARGWEKTKSKSRLTWDKARDATRDAWDRIDNPDRYSGTTSSSGSVGAPQAYPGHTSEAGEMPSSESTTGRMSGTDLSSGFSGTRTAGTDDRTGGMMGTDIGDRDVDDFTSSSCRRYEGRRFDDVENDLHRDWDTSRYGARKTWDNVKDSVRRAWHKVERAMPGDADRDGR